MPFGCKRPLASNLYYPTFNLPHVELVTDAITEVTEHGIVTADGTTREVDTIILATGFATTKFLAALDVIGRDGIDIDDAWADGPQAYLGITTTGFPNLFMLYGPNTNNGSIIYMIECQVDYVMQMLDAMDEHDLAWVDVKRDVMDEYNDARPDDARRRRGVAGRVQRLLPRRRSHRHAVARFDERVPRAHRASAESRRVRDARRVGRHMDVGVTIPHTGRNASPAWVREYCTAAEQLGFDSLWGVDHLVMPHHTDSDYTLGRKPAKIGDDAVSGLLSPNYEMMTTLTWVAGFTERMKLGTAVAVLPIRNAVHNARALATLDVYSGGRVVYGVGVGWLREEAEAMGMPWDRRGARSEEHIALMRTLWCAEGDLVEFHGEFHDLPPMDPEPRPVQRPIPILIGGHSDIALERAGRIGDGWIAAQMSPERVAEHWPRVLESAERNGRDPASVRLFTSTPVRSDRSLGRAARRSTASSASSTCRSACTASPARRRSTRCATSRRMCCRTCAADATARPEEPHGTDRRTEAGDPHPGAAARDADRRPRPRAPDHAPAPVTRPEPDRPGAP